MAGMLVQVLDLSLQEQNRLGKLLSRIKTVNEFLKDALDGFKDAGFVKALAEALPWAEAAVQGAKEVVPAVKFVVAVFEKLTRTPDPKALAYLAFTLAYQRAVEQAVTALGEPSDPRRIDDEVKAQLVAREDDVATLDFSRFSLGDVLLHPFVKQADAALEQCAEAAGYDEKQQRALVGDVHQRFVVGLKTLLAHGDSREKFAPLADFLHYGTGEAASYAALIEHADYQRRLFEETPVFGKEPFSLAHVYIETECGRLTWGQIRGEDRTGSAGSVGNGRTARAARPDLSHGEDGARVDPFRETAPCGGRHPLLETVLEYFGDPKFRDAVVIQGVAGAGKSAFTLRLCAELVRQGLRPIRVLLRDVQVNQAGSITEGLAERVRLHDENERAAYPRPDDLFLGGKIFDEAIRFGNATICPYVLVLDGWDEISIATSETFKQRLDWMLDKVRAELLNNFRSVPVRVVLTGRPTVAVTETNFLLRNTPILTVRPLHPGQLQKFVGNLSRALASRKLAAVAEGTGWKPFKPMTFSPVFARYRADFDQARKTEGQYAGISVSASGGSLDVLGLPLLAHLAVRLLSEPGADVEALINNPTTLYRSLVDLTCGKAGKYEGAAEDVERRYLKTGDELRDLLRQTAAAMTVCGQENIAYEELSLRVRFDENNVMNQVQAATRDHELAQLMISYYLTLRSQSVIVALGQAAL